MLEMNWFAGREHENGPGEYSLKAARRGVHTVAVDDGKNFPAYPRFYIHWDTVMSLYRQLYSAGGCYGLDFGYVLPAALHPAAV